MGFYVGQPVRILSYIGEELNDDRIGVIEKIDGGYIDIRLNKSKALVERYPNEITELWEVDDEN